MKSVTRPRQVPSISAKAQKILTLFSCGWHEIICTIFIFFSFSYSDQILRFYLSEQRPLNSCSKSHGILIGNYGILYKRPKLYKGKCAEIKLCLAKRSGHWESLVSELSLNRMCGDHYCSGLPRCSCEILSRKWERSGDAVPSKSDHCSETLDSSPDHRLMFVSRCHNYSQR